LLAKSMGSWVHINEFARPFTGPSVFANMLTKIP
jgi:hypothetical protein